MAYTKIYEGQTLGPGMTFPDHCYFKNCTFKATCTFGKGSHFVGCTWSKCCPKPNNNAPSKVIDSIVVDSTLESVHLNKGTLGVNNKSTGYMVTDESWKRDGIVEGQGSECMCYCGPPTNCEGPLVLPKPVSIVCTPCTPINGTTERK